MHACLVLDFPGCISNDLLLACSLLNYCVLNGYNQERDRYRLCSIPFHARLVNHVRELRCMPKNVAITVGSMRDSRKVARHGAS